MKYVHRLRFDLMELGVRLLGRATRVGAFSEPLLLAGIEHSRRQRGL